ncbi:MAG: helix-turn-helix transcriptional regulator [Schwartzia sp.]|nr:helix-turn-helix transcriptional regulator [Schwartzia sp. (in: firmicutes)]
MSSNFGERLRTLRKERKVSISLLSQITGVSRRSIYYWESGKKVPKSMATVQILAKFFGVSTEAFFRDTGIDLSAEVRQLREEVAELRRYIKGDDIQ